MSLLLRVIVSLYARIIGLYKWILFKIAKNWVILNRIHVSVRPYIWKMTGCNIGKNVSIGYDVYYDVGNASLITLEDDVWIASRALILCHRRDMTVYCKNERYNDLPYIISPVVIMKGACVSMNAIIMPGVTIGEGAIVGASALVLKELEK